MGATFFSLTRWTTYGRGYGGREKGVISSSGYFGHHYRGDDRLRQRDSSMDLLLFGIAMVPVTHLLHTIDAKSSILSVAEKIANSVKLPAFEPAFA